MIRCFHDYTRFINVAYSCIGLVTVNINSYIHLPIADTPLRHVVISKAVTTITIVIILPLLISFETVK